MGLASTSEPFDPSSMQDDAIISMQTKPSNSKPNGPQTRAPGGERTLEKTSWVSKDVGAGVKSAMNTTLYDMDSGSGGAIFDQFKGKRTDYDFNMYSTTIDER